MNEVFAAFGVDPLGALPPDPREIFARKNVNTGLVWIDGKREVG